MGSTVRITPTHNAFAWGGPKSKLSGEKWRITLVNPAIPAMPGGRFVWFFFGCSASARHRLAPCAARCASRRCLNSGRWEQTQVHTGSHSILSSLSGEPAARDERFSGQERPEPPAQALMESSRQTVVNALAGA